MAKGAYNLRDQGPFRADQLRSGDPYELSNGHPIHCLHTGGRGSRATSVGAGVLASDPAVQDVGVDTGFTPSPGTLRAPDLAVGELPDQPGWVEGAPALAVEYADTGQDEADLQLKMQELFAAGTRYIWVVRLVGPRRVEVHQPGQRPRTANPGERLDAPGILANPIPVEALWDRQVAGRVMFDNLLQRQGYASLAEVRAEAEAEGEAQGRVEGEAQGARKAIVTILESRGLTVDEELRTALAQCSDLAVLEAALRQAATGSPAGIVAILRG